MFSSLLFLLMHSNLAVADGPMPPIRYFLINDANQVEITKSSAETGLSRIPRIKNERCAKEIAAVIDQSKRDVDGPMIQRLARLRRVPSRATSSLRVTYRIDVFGNLGSPAGRPHPDSYHCVLSVMTTQLPSEKNAEGSALVFDKHPGVNKFMKGHAHYDDHGLSKSAADKVNAAILTGAYVDLLDLLDVAKSPKDEEYFPPATNGRSNESASEILR